jgi:hypothetical protein
MTGHPIALDHPQQTWERPAPLRRNGAFSYILSDYKKADAILQKVASAFPYIEAWLNPDTSSSSRIPVPRLLCAEMKNDAVTNSVAMVPPI